MYEQKEARLKEISELLDIPVEKLRPDHVTLFDSLKKLFVEEKDPVKEAGLKRLREVLKKHEEELAANPYLPQIEAVKREHAAYRIKGVLNDLLQLTEPQGGGVVGTTAYRPSAKRISGAGSRAADSASPAASRPLTACSTIGRATMIRAWGVSRVRTSPREPPRRRRRSTWLRNTSNEASWPPRREAS